MLQLPRIPELAQRDRFVRRAVKEGRVLTLGDEECACVPSQQFVGRTVQLFWSSPVEAKRWAQALSGDDELQEIGLSTFASDILPGLASAKGFAGTDWVSDPIEPEVDPRDLLLRLKHEAVGGLLKALSDRGEVYFVAGDDGPRTAPSARQGGEMLAVFASRQGAEKHMKQIEGRSVMADPVADFIGSTLPWASQRGLVISLEPIAGAGALELKADDVVRRLAADQAR